MLATAGLLLASLAFAFAFQQSAVFGRLAMPLTWDDIVYINRGFELYQRLLAGEAGHLLIALSHDHAPFQTAQATLAFLIFGPHGWAPYVVSGCLLFVVTLVIRPMLRDLPVPTAIGVVLLIVASPWAANIVAEFRPDLFWGFLCGWSCFLIIRRSSLQPPWRNQVPMVVTAALAIYWKPSAVMVSGILVATASLLALWQTWREQRRTGAEFGSALKTYTVSALTLLAALAIYFGPNALALFSYFEKFVAVAPVFTYPASSLAQANFYLFGPTYGQGLGFLLWIAVAVPIIHTVVRPEPILGSAPRYWLFAVIVVIAYVIPTLSPAKTYYLGGAFYGCALWFTLTGMIDLLQCVEAAAPTISRVAAPAVLAALCLATFTPHPLQTTLPVARIAELRSLSDEVAAAIVLDMDRRHVQSAVVFFQTPDPVGSGYIEWRAKLARKAVTLLNGFYFAGPDEDRQSMNRADYAFLSEQAQDLNYPGDRLNNEVMAWAKQQPSFSVLLDLVDPHQRHSYLLKRTTNWPEAVEVPTSIMRLPALR